MDNQSLKERLIPLKQLFQSVQKQALAESPGPGEEVVLSLFNQMPGKAGLVDVVIPFLADLSEGLKPIGSFLHIRRLMNDSEQAPRRGSVCRVARWENPQPVH
jgi:hypothetical protein